VRFLDSVKCWHPVRILHPPAMHRPLLQCFVWANTTWTAVCGLYEFGISREAVVLGPERFVDGEQWEKPLSPEEAGAAVKRVRAIAADPLPPGRRSELLAEVIDVPAPDLRSESGRLDAKLIAEALGIAVRKLADAVQVSAQVLNETPDSPPAQVALHPFARVIEALRVMLPEDRRKAWLHSPQARWDNRSPLEVMLAGDAEAVARTLELIRDGGMGQ